MVKNNRICWRTFLIISIWDNCFIPGIILQLEEPSSVGKFYIFSTLMFVLLVEVDKKIIFHNILAMEYLMKNRNYSNSEYFFSTWMIIMLFAFALLWSFMGYAYRMISSSENSYHVNVYLTLNLLFYLEKLKLLYTGCLKKKWILGFMPYRVFPIHCEHFRGHLNISGGSYTKIKSCQVILKLFHIFLPNFDP